MMVASHRRRSKLRDLAAIALVEILGYALLRDRVWPPSLVLVGLSLLGLWWCFAMPTWCDQATNNGRTCRRPVYGKLRGCSWHSRDKRDAVFALFSLQNPGRAFRMAWQAPDAADPVTTRGRRPSRRDAYDGIMLAATVGSFLVGTAGAVFSGLALA